MKKEELVSDENLAAEATDGQDESSEKTYDAGAEDEDDEVDDTFRDKDCEVKEDCGHLLILDSAESRCRRKKRVRKFGSGISRVLPDCGCGSDVLASSGGKSSFVLGRSSPADGSEAPQIITLAIAESQYRTMRMTRLKFYSAN